MTAGNGRVVRAAWTALVAVAAVVLVPGVAWAGDGSASITDLEVSHGSAAFSVSVDALPAGTALDPSRTQVRLDGRPLAARTAGRATSASGARVAVLVVDTSGSMGPDGIAAARVAATAYAAHVAPDVRVGLIGFADHPVTLTAPTTDRAALRAGLNRLAPHGETALYDAVTLAVRTAGQGGSVVVLSDGADTVSRSGLAATTATVRACGCRVSTVAFRTADAERGPLVELAQAGRGRVVHAGGARSLADAFARAAVALVAQLDVVVALPDASAAGGRLTVTVAGGQHSWTASTSLPVTAAATSDRPSAAAAPASALLTGTPWYRSLWALLGAVFVGLLALGVSLAPARDDVVERRRRALEVYRLSGRPVTRASEDEPEEPAAGGVLSLSQRYVERRGLTERLTLELDRAGSHLRPAEWLVLRACVAVASVAVFTVVTRHLLLSVVLGLLVGWLGSHLWLRRRQRRRAAAFADALPDTLQLVATSLRTGFSLPQALDAAQHDGVEPVGPELGRALAAARIGAPLEDELEQVAVRTSSEDWSWAVMAIRIQRSVGGNLAEVLLTTVRTLRERAMVRRQVRALSAEGRLSAYVLIALPVFVTALLLTFRRDYLRPLWTTVPGLVMVSVALLLLGVGTWWMSRVVKVEV